jgi:hypothetical protein
MKRLTPDDRGVSEVVAFTLTFSLIIATISILFSGGILSLNDLRVSEQVNTADQSMERVASIQRSLHEGEAPRRSVDVGLAGGSLELRDSSIDISVSDSSGTTLYDDSVNVGSFEYVLNRVDSVISVENGVLFRRDESGGTLIRTRPPMRCTDTVAVVSTLELAGSVSTASGGSVEVNVRRVRGGLDYPNDVSTDAAADAANVTIDVRDSRNENGWRQFFQDSSQEWDGSDGVYYCDGVDRVYVYKTTVDISTP